MVEPSTPLRGSASIRCSGISSRTPHPPVIGAGTFGLLREKNDEPLILAQITPCRCFCVVILGRARSLESFAPISVAASRGFQEQHAPLWFHLHPLSVIRRSPLQGRRNDKVRTFSLLGLREIAHCAPPLDLLGKRLPEFSMRIRGLKIAPLLPQYCLCFARAPTPAREGSRDGQPGGNRGFAADAIEECLAFEEAPPRVTRAAARARLGRLSDRAGLSHAQRRRRNLHPRISELEPSRASAPPLTGGQSAHALRGRSCGLALSR